jgi:hypothetical protein
MAVLRLGGDYGRLQTKSSRVAVATLRSHCSVKNDTRKPSFQMWRSRSSWSLSHAQSSACISRMVSSRKLLSRLRSEQAWLICHEAKAKLRASLSNQALWNYEPCHSYFQPVSALSGDPHSRSSLIFRQDFRRKQNSAFLPGSKRINSVLVSFYPCSILAPNGYQSAVSNRADFFIIFWELDFVKSRMFEQRTQPHVNEGELSSGVF